jgi:hypothetical protein
MRIDEIVVAEKIAWKRRGNKLKKQFRCSSGPRKGRVVAEPSQCFKAIDIKKRMTLKRTKAKMGGRLQRKAGRTKKFNPISRRLKTLNR